MSEEMLAVEYEYDSTYKCHCVNCILQGRVHGCMRWCVERASMRAFVCESV